MSRRNLTGARIVLTGARGGIGTAARAALEPRGARIVGIDLYGGDGIVAADVRDVDSIRGAIDRAAEEMGGIDILVNNAGIGRAHDSGAFPDAEARAVMDVNFFGTWNATAAAMPHLLRSKGHVVNVASGLAFVDLPFAATYSASKRALVAYSASLSLEYAGRVTVAVVYPGYVRTGIHDAPNAAGASLEGLVRADSVDGAAAAIVRACARPGVATSSARSSIEYWAARRFPRLTARVIARRFARWCRANALPDFVVHR